MRQYIGLILLIIAVAAGVYLVNHYPELTLFKIPIPVTVKPVVVPPPQKSKEVTSLIDEKAAVLEVPKPASITAIRFPNSFHPYLEVVLSSRLTQDRTLNVTGWAIKSDQGLFTISKAQNIYSFGGTEDDIILRPSDQVHLYSGESPKGNFRLNKCLGYLGESTSFTPSLPRACPRVARSEISHLSGFCQDYVLSLRSCENPSANPPVRYDDTACHNFLSNLNYVGCVSKYGKDQDFLSNEWRIWLSNRIQIFDPRHDKVQLLDIGGKIVDEYNY